MLLHQGVGLDGFNSCATAKATHALFECVNSRRIADRVIATRPYSDYQALFTRIDEIVAGLEPDCLRDLLASVRPPSSRTNDVDARQKISAAEVMYEQHFGFGYVAVDTDDADVVTAITLRMHNAPDVETKYVRSAVTRITCRRVARMLGPEDGYPEYPI